MSNSSEEVEEELLLVKNKTTNNNNDKSYNSSILPLPKPLEPKLENINNNGKIHDLTEEIQQQELKLNGTKTTSSSLSSTFSTFSSSSLSYNNDNDNENDKVEQNYNTYYGLLSPPFDNSVILPSIPTTISTTISTIPIDPALTSSTSSEYSQRSTPNVPVKFTYPSSRSGPPRIWQESIPSEITSGSDGINDRNGIEGREEERVDNIVGFNNSNSLPRINTSNSQSQSQRRESEDSPLSPSSSSSHHSHHQPPQYPRHPPYQPQQAQQQFFPSHSHHHPQYQQPNYASSNPHGHQQQQISHHSLPHLPPLQHSHQHPLYSPQGEEGGRMILEGPHSYNSNGNNTWDFDNSQQQSQHQQQHQQVNLPGPSSARNGYGSPPINNNTSTTGGAAGSVGGGAAAGEVGEELEGPCKPFISKLAYLLRTPMLYSDVIRWDDSGTSFIIAPSQKMISVVLPEIYLHRSVAAFTRQLNTYGFHHLTSTQLAHKFEFSPDSTTPIKELSAWSHPNFQRDLPHLLPRLVPRPSRAREAHRKEKERVLLGGGRLRGDGRGGNGGGEEEWEEEEEVVEERHEGGRRKRVRR